jgi:diphthine synthase
MALFMIGIGLDNEKDISVKGLDAVKRCDYVYLESYTSKLNCEVKALEKLYGKKIILADRDIVEKNAEQTILKQAKDKDVAFLVIGDIFGATTHNDLRMRALKESIKVIYVHNASIMNAIGVTGLELYKFGKTTSIPFENKDVTTPYDVLAENVKNNLHTLVLLDLRPEQGKFMTVKEAVEYLLKVEKQKRQKVFTENTMCIGCARIGSASQKIAYGKASELLEQDFGSPVHCLTVPAKLHFMEEEALELFKIK